MRLVYDFVEQLTALDQQFYIKFTKAGINQCQNLNLELQRYAALENPWSKLQSTHGYIKQISIAFTYKTNNKLSAWPRYMHSSSHVCLVARTFDP